MHSAKFKVRIGLIVTLPFYTFAAHNIPCTAFLGGRLVDCMGCAVTSGGAGLEGVGLSGLIPLQDTPAHTWIERKGAENSKA